MEDPCLAETNTHFLFLWFLSNDKHRHAMTIKSNKWENVYQLSFRFSAMFFVVIPKYIEIDNFLCSSH